MTHSPTPSAAEVAHGLTPAEAIRHGLALAGHAGGWQPGSGITKLYTAYLGLDAGYRSALMRALPLTVWGFEVGANPDTYASTIREVLA